MRSTSWVTLFLAAWYLSVKLEAFQLLDGGLPGTRCDPLQAELFGFFCQPVQFHGLLADFGVELGALAFKLLGLGFARARSEDHCGTLRHRLLPLRYTKNNALKGRRFASLGEENAHLIHWEEQVADKRVHGTTRRQVAAMFEEERKALGPLPASVYESYQRGPPEGTPGQFCGSGQPKLDLFYH